MKPRDQVGNLIFGTSGVGYEMVVIREHRPLLERPARVSECDEEPLFEQRESLLISEKVLLEVGACCYEVSARMVDDPRWTVGPVFHENMLGVLALLGQGLNGLRTVWEC